MSSLIPCDSRRELCLAGPELPLEPIPFGLVGLNFGRSIVRHLKEGRAKDIFHLAAVCDLDREKVEDFSRRTGAKAVYSLEDLLREDRIRAIGLFTPPQGRAELVRKIIRSGRDVITTKPFETDPSAAREVLEEASRMGRTVHLNSPSPELSPDLALIERWRDEFGIGEPVACRADVWCSYREDADGSWYDDPGACPSAPVFRLGIYLINDLVRLFGPAKRVSVLESRLYTGRPTPDNAQIGILFENGALANVFASFCVEDGDHYRNSMTLNYSNGTIYRNAGPERVSTEEDGSELALVMAQRGKRKLVRRAVVPSGSGSYQWEAFARAIRGEQAPVPDVIDQVVAGLQILRAMQMSAECGLPVDIS